MIDPRLRARGGERDVSSPAIRREERSEIPVSDSKARTKSGTHRSRSCIPERMDSARQLALKSLIAGQINITVLFLRLRAHAMPRTPRKSPRAICRTKCTLAAVQAVRARARGRSEMRA